jgi:hypothetical protein
MQSRKGTVVTVSTDIKVMNTRELLEALDSPNGFNIPDEVLDRIDAQGYHTFQKHSLFNPDPEDEFVHARTMFKLYDTDVEDLTITVIDIPRFWWDCMPNFSAAV